MKKYIKPISEIVLLGSEDNILENNLTGASIADVDKNSVDFKDINEGNPNTWGGDAKGSDWNGWDD